MTVRFDESLEGIDWAQAKTDLAADDFDNGRSPGALRASFERSQHVAIARDGDRVRAGPAGVALALDAARLGLVSRRASENLARLNCSKKASDASARSAHACEGPAPMPSRGMDRRPRPGVVAAADPGRTGLAATA